MTDLDRIGGVPVVMRALLEAGLMHGDCLTVSGRTIGEELAELAPPELDGTVLAPLNRPLHSTGGIAILRGSLAPDGAVVKSAGMDTLVFEGTARVFDGEALAMEAVTENRIKAGDIVVIRWEGPKGGPGMREMLAVTAAIKGCRVRQGGRPAHRRPFLGCDQWPVRRSPGAGIGGLRPIALVEDGDRITLDVPDRRSICT